MRPSRLKITKPGVPTRRVISISAATRSGVMAMFVAVAPMPETDYTRMYVVVAGAAGRARLLRLSMP